MVTDRRTDDASLRESIAKKISQYDPSAAHGPATFSNIDVQEIEPNTVQAAAVDILITSPLLNATFE